MRPLPGGDALPSAKSRSRKSSVAEASASTSASNNGPSSHVPTAFFMRSEQELEQTLAASQSTEASSRQRESTFGVQSLADTLETAFGSSSRVEDSKGDTVCGNTAYGKDSSEYSPHGSPRDSKKGSENPRASPPRTRKRKMSNIPSSNPLTPLNGESPPTVPASAMPSTPRSSSLHSLKLSDEDPASDEGASQAIVSSGDEEDAFAREASSFPQLVMPSIQMPSRRPFTEKGKAMGKLKVLVTGAAGTGKTSLIRSIVQLCDDIVHVDPLSPSSSLSQPAPPKTQSQSRRKDEVLGTTRIIEIHASTKSYPYWWTDVEESRTLRRRKSTADAILERNICFVDTPGFSTGPSGIEGINHVVDYVESLLYQTVSMTTLDDNDVIGVISGNGGISVDAIIYLLAPIHDISRDIEVMQRLSALSNVIPVIAKSDTVSSAELVAIKTSILARLQATSIRPFFFGTTLDDALLTVQGLPVNQQASPSNSTAPASETKEFPFPKPTHPYAVSSTTGPDTDTMDASLLMSPDYVQPLFPSELATLVNQVFDPESISWLRHSAAKKFLHWRSRTELPGDSFILHGPSEQPLKRGSISSTSVGLNTTALNMSSTSSIFSAASPSGVLVPQTGSPFYASNLQSPFSASSPSLSNAYPETLDNPTDFSLTRYHHAVQGEQKFTEVRLAKWATDLQRSLRNEKDRYEELQRSERAKWLLERVGEEVASGNIVTSPGGSPRADWAVVRRGNGKEASRVVHRYGTTGRLDSRDPLGLCDFSDEVKRRGYVLVKVLGGVSVLGAAVLAIVRACGWELGLPEGKMWSWVNAPKD